MSAENAAGGDQRLVFEAHVKEAEFLRAESLVCIEHVRRLAIYSTSIAGFALPVLAGLLDFGDGVDTISSFAEVVAALEERHVILQFLCLGVSLTCLAFLRIYVGSFTQIFTFAKYFRDYLVPSINALLGSPEKQVFHWENWLGDNRRDNSFFVGDADLSAEPVLIALYVTVYMAAAVFISIYFKSFVVFTVVAAIFAALLVLQTFIRFYLVLRRAAAP